MRIDPRDCEMDIERDDYNNSFQKNKKKNIPSEFRKTNSKKISKSHRQNLKNK